MWGPPSGGPGPAEAGPHVLLQTNWEVGAALFVLEHEAVGPRLPAQRRRLEIEVANHHGPLLEQERQGAHRALAGQREETQRVGVRARRKVRLYVVVEDPRVLPQLRDLRAVGEEHLLRRQR